MCCTPRQGASSSGNLRLCYQAPHSLGQVLNFKLMDVDAHNIHKHPAQSFTKQLGTRSLATWPLQSKHLRGFKEYYGNTRRKGFKVMVLRSPRKKQVSFLGIYLGMHLFIYLRNREKETESSYLLIHTPNVSLGPGQTEASFRSPT